MPVINGVTAETAMGLTSLVSVDGVVPASLVGQAALKPTWLNAAGRVLLYVRENPPATFFAQSLDLDTSTLATVSAAPVTSVIGGDSVWAVYDATYGVKSSVGGLGPFVNAGLVEVNNVGSTAILTNATAGGLTVYDDAGLRLFTIAGAVTAGTAHLRGNYLSWLDPSLGWQIYDITTAAQVEWARRLDDVTALIPVTISGKLYVVEQFTNGAGSDVITIRGAISTSGTAIATGYTVATVADAFQLDAVSTASGVARIAWSTTVAEALTDLRVALVTISSGAFSLGTTAAGALAFTTQTALKKKQYAVTPYGGAHGTFIEMQNHPFVNRDDLKLTTPWHKAIAKVLDVIGQPINLNTGVTGTLPAVNVDIDGTTVLPGTLPLSAIQSQAASTVVGRGSASAGSPQVITLGAGMAMTGTVLSSTGAGGDVVGPASSVDKEIALFDGVTGKLLERATGTGVVRVTSGVYGTPGPVSLTMEVTGDLPYANLTPATAASRLLGRGSASGAGDWQEVTLGSNLTMTGTVLDSTGGGGGSWLPLVDGSEPPVFITDGAGHLITVAYTP